MITRLRPHPASMAAAACAAAVALSACGGVQRVEGVCGDPGTAEPGDAAAAAAAGDAAWEQRRDEAQLRAAIGHWEKAARIDPRNADVRVKLSRARYFFADGHLRMDDEKEAEMIEMFDKGIKDAEVAIAQLAPGYRSDICAAKPFTEAIKQGNKEAVPAMYWYASNLGKWGLAKGIITVLKYKDNIKAMMDRVMELDPTFFYHAPSRYFGAYYTKVPFPAGDMEQSKKNFEASIAGSPQYLATKVLMAQEYATKTKDRALFERLLKEVVGFDLNSAPEILPENAIEQKKARDLLDDIDTYFGE